MGEKGGRQWQRGSTLGTVVVFDFDEGGELLHYAARQWPQKARQGQRHARGSDSATHARGLGQA